MKIKLDNRFLFPLGLKGIKGEVPPCFPRYYPREYREPDTHYSPKVFGLMGSVLADAWTAKKGEKTTAEMLCYATLANNKVPTWWVGAELFEALVDTKTPAIPLDEIRWPSPAMLFCLPIEQTKKFFSRHVPYIAMVRDTYGTKVVPNSYVSKTITTEPDVDNVDMPYQIICGTSFHLDGHPDGTLVAHSPLKHNLVPSDLFSSNNAPFFYDSPDTPMDKEHDTFMVDKLIHLAFQFVVLMSMCKGMETLGGVLIPALTEGKHETKRVLKPALWAPKWIGRDYRKPRPAPQGGHHASPQCHLRSGHWRAQRFGPGLAETKALWIEPTWVNVETTNQTNGK